MITKINTYNFNYNPSFKSSLDDEKSSLKSKLTRLKDEANTYKKLKTTETNNFNAKIKVLDNDIKYARSFVNLTEKKINIAKNSINKKKKQIDAEKDLTNNLIAQINSNNEQIQKHQKKQKELFNESLERTKILEENCAKKISTEVVYLGKVYENNFFKSKNGPKQQIIETLINPTIKLMDGNDNNLPSLVLFETDYCSDETFTTEKTVLEWIAKTSDSNFARINASDFEDKNNLIHLLKKLSFQALKEYEKCGQYSYTMISNFDIINPAELEQENIDFLNKLFCESAKLFNNTIIAVTNNFKNNEWSKNLTFKSIKFDKNFVTDKLFGLPSIIKNMATTQFSGHDLLKIIK